jgi:hypothetical protein
MSSHGQNADDAIFMPTGANFLNMPTLMFHMREQRIRESTGR